MEIYIEKQLSVILYSLILGLIFGGLYDIMRIIHILCGIATYQAHRTTMKRGRLPFILFFILDIAYMLTLTVCFSVFQYWQMNGRFCWFVLLSTLIGAALWHKTAGRAVMSVSETLVSLLRRAIHCLIIVPFCFIYSSIRRLLYLLAKHTVLRVLSAAVCAIRCVRHSYLRGRLVRDIGGTQMQRKKLRKQL